ncbi:MULTISPECIES: hypothetical protein [Burkholderia]|uniref:hypothetical protein n=1 Tax=Burkholderia TaxID=32008 RepID=UPI0011997096|nr:MULTISPECIES: hypothetical protein [Burkholderia]MDN7737922.1 hypothetical protein [Burkholderia gladioli]TWC75530.1 hypothetical protein FB600_104190 [Burkholderia sp. SJZ089]TWD05043.1 hypothetical protein FBX98_104190 [Burkholderia sp. SJZ115]
MSTPAATTFGTRSAYNQGNLDPQGEFSQIAETDGFVMATVGQPAAGTNYFGTFEGVTTAGGAITSFAYATGLAYHLPAQQSKKGPQNVYVPVPGSFTLPVRAGETWTVRLTALPDMVQAPQVEFYWIPIEHGGAGGGAGGAGSASAMADALARLRADLHSGVLRASMLASTQRAIDGRVDDLIQVLGDTVNPASGEIERRQFASALRRIVCSATPPGEAADNRVADADLHAVIAAFAELTGRGYTSEQRALFADGVRALVRINDNEANRHDLVLIKRNVDLFLDNLQAALGQTLSHSERRLLTRALTRIVGDGSQGQP